MTAHSDGFIRNVQLWWFCFCAFVVSWYWCIALFWTDLICLNSLKFIPTWLKMEAKLFVAQIISSFIFDCLLELVIPCISQTFCKLQWILWTFLCPSSVACLVLNLLHCSDILSIALDQKFSSFFRNLWAWVEQYKINLFHHQTSYGWSTFYLLIACAIQYHSHSFNDLHVGLKI